MNLTLAGGWPYRSSRRTGRTSKHYGDTDQEPSLPPASAPASARTRLRDPCRLLPEALRPGLGAVTWLRTTSPRSITDACQSSRSRRADDGAGAATTTSWAATRRLDEARASFYEFTTMIATLDPPPHMQVFAAIVKSEAMDGFARERVGDRRRVLPDENIGNLAAARARGGHRA